MDTLTSIKKISSNLGNKGKLEQLTTNCCTSMHLDCKYNEHSLSCFQHVMHPKLRAISKSKTLRCRRHPHQTTSLEPCSAAAARSFCAGPRGKRPQRAEAEAAALRHAQRLVFGGKDLGWVVGEWAEKLRNTP